MNLMPLETALRQEIASQIESIAYICGEIIRDSCDSSIISDIVDKVIPDTKTEYIGTHHRVKIGDFVCEALIYNYPDQYENPLTYAVGLQFRDKTVFLAEIPIEDRPIQLLLPFGQEEREEIPGWNINNNLHDIYIPGEWEKELKKIYEKECLILELLE